jgi:hypothetical protein
MRLPAKNATAPVVAFAFAVAGALQAGAQGTKEHEAAPVPGTAPPANVAPARPAASPDSSAAKVAPLSRETERSVSAPSVSAPGERLHTDGGLRGDYWRGTPFALLAEALPRLPIRVTSPIMRALTLEVLTVPAEARGGAWMAARLAALRAERLYAMGQLEAAEAAFRMAEIAKGDPARAPAEIETKLLLHGSEAACAAVAEHLAARRTLYLERASIACHAFAGAHGLAALGLGRLRERGVAIGDMFGGLVMAQQPELARAFASFNGADAWSVQLLAATPLPWPEDAMRMGTPALLRAVALSGNGPDAVRIGAAERAFLLGAIDRSALVALYSAVRFGKDAFGRAARPPAADTPLQRALLFQAAALAANPPTRIEILANWWRMARHDRRELLAALVTAPLVHDLVPGLEWGENAVTISRVLFQAGDLERALHWYGRLRGATLNDMEAYMRLGAIAQLADTGGKAWTAADSDAWAAYQRSQAAGERRIALLRALAQGLASKRREDVSSKIARIGESLGAGARSVDRPLADWREIRAAAQTGRQGEAILQMLTALGHDGVARAEPHALGAAVGVLATLGRGAEARRLAVEAALANGF